MPWVSCAVETGTIRIPDETNSLLANTIPKYVFPDIYDGVYTILDNYNMLQ